MTDLYAGYHERTEYHVTGGDGRRVRGHAELDGTIVHGSPAAGWHIAGNAPGSRVTIRLQPGETASAQRTECRRLASKSGRARCALCAEITAA